ncbi:hypothetical protein [Mesorhizobium sp. M0488]|uniref:hypothetical protein n=1 Tax=unclassified Mesorhizobium TaxID=325217 RepID=UPI0033371CDC
MSRNKGEKGERLAVEIRRQFGTEAMKRFLRTLPAFRAEVEIPERFREQLKRLDSVESNIAVGRQ